MEKQEAVVQHSGRAKRPADKVSAGHAQEYVHGKITPTASGAGLKPGVRRRTRLRFGKTTLPTHEAQRDLNSNGASSAAARSSRPTLLRLKGVATPYPITPRPPARCFSRRLRRRLASASTF